MSETTTARRPSGSRALFGVLTLGCFLAVVALQSPHLVHHLFEPATNQPDCAFASVSERAQGTPVEIETLIPWHRVERVVSVANQPAPLSIVPAAYGARSPPLLAS